MKFLYDYQIEAIKKMHNGCILNGGVGTGKSRTALSYYYILCGGDLFSEKITPVKNLIELYIITTALKRDSKEWELELLHLNLCAHIDSWNNIKKYENIENAFFIFDEDRVIGNGAWVKAFLKIAKKNKWIILSATPGDTWTDYIPVFIANGFYRNRTDFYNQHIIWNRFAKYPKVDKYVGTKKLYALRDQLLVPMEVQKETERHEHIIFVEYDKYLYKRIMKDRWNVFEDKPLRNAAELCFNLRKVINTNPEKLDIVIEILRERKRAIIFYNYNYELEMLKSIECDLKDYEMAEWNGLKHEKCPVGENWFYLVQYNAGSEGWNCITSDTIIFLSQNYSYRMMEQAAGRIDRANTPYKDLHYYYIKSHAGIDLAIDAALKKKKKFNERTFAGDW